MGKFNQMINFAQLEIPIQNPENQFWRFSAQSPIDKARRGTSFSSPSTSSEEKDELDLSLCLSLGGVYAKPREEKPLIRSSSLAGETHARRSEAAAEVAGARPPSLSLSRSCSLPAEANEEAARLRRMAVKKRLAEKQRSPPSPAPPAEVVAWAAESAAKSAALGRAITRIKTQNFRQMEGQEFLTTANDNANLKPFLQQRDGMDPSEGSELEQNPTKKVRASSGKVLSSWADVMNRMPSVTTTGDGPNGKRIEGFLYKYTKGQVSIVCVCHGSFLSPAQFVHHAGGMEVANPMRHINVCTALPL